MSFRRTFRITALAVLPTTMIPATPASPSLTLETLNYKGWANSVALSGERYRVVVVPSIGGRVMEYSANGRGPVWTNALLHGKVLPLDPKEWRNYGGYKTWPAPQSRWGWPPDTLLDTAPATVTPWRKNGRLYGLRITGQKSAKTGIAYDKWLRLDPKTGTLTLRQTMRALGTNPSPVRWGLWDITQVNAEGRIVVPLDRRSRHKGGVYFFDPKARASGQWKVSDGLLMISNRGEVTKYGVETQKGWMAWLSGDQAYIKRFPRMLRGHEYPDQYSTAQVYTNGKDLPYTEMEITGPLVTLSPGQSTTFEEEWRLVKLPKRVQSDRDIMKAIRTLSRRGFLHPYPNGVILPAKK